MQRARASQGKLGQAETSRGAYAKRKIADTNLTHLVAAFLTVKCDGFATCHWWRREGDEKTIASSTASLPALGPFGAKLANWEIQ